MKKKACDKKSLKNIDINGLFMTTYSHMYSRSKEICYYFFNWWLHHVAFLQSCNAGFYILYLGKSLDTV